MPRMGLEERGRGRVTEELRLLQDLQRNPIHASSDVFSGGLLPGKGVQDCSLSGGRSVGPYWMRPYPTPTAFHVHAGGTRLHAARSRRGGAVCPSPDCFHGVPPGIGSGRSSPAPRIARSPETAVRKSAARSPAGGRFRGLAGLQLIRPSPEGGSPINLDDSRDPLPPPLQNEGLAVSSQHLGEGQTRRALQLGAGCKGFSERAPPRQLCARAGFPQARGGGGGGPRDEQPCSARAKFPARGNAVCQGLWRARAQRKLGSNLSACGRGGRAGFLPVMFPCPCGRGLKAPPAMGTEGREHQLQWGKKGTRAATQMPACKPGVRQVLQE